ncbi:hypothetical protein [Microvirga tunisiensis]|uniref:Uncharacterized protein n=1 Tax=Microvirga tunisiensis TaxID=2108360 RepID=A0A5N7MV77_9HYPH|nr:hypothetical protein [Microvirga tunisiensis]MPR12965.1 hypothetical protein [Microvirga tunisiensis]MPR30893.1 hypothetical protein [Microvirga tunisiensis]
MEIERRIQFEQARMTARSLLGSRFTPEEAEVAAELAAQRHPGTDAKALADRICSDRASGMRRAMNLLSLAHAQVQADATAAIRGI